MDAVELRTPPGLHALCARTRPMDDGYETYIPASSTGRSNRGTCQILRDNVPGLSACKTAEQDLSNACDVRKAGS